jgi:glutaconate CoA-transferase, subunit B
VNWTPDELMTVAAARELRDGQVVFVDAGGDGGVPSRAAALARRLHAPDLVLVHGSGAVDAGPVRGLTTVGVNAVAQWLQAGRCDVGFLGAAQIDRFANLNSTVVGEYTEPDVRLAGSGWAPEVAAGCREVVVVLPHRMHAFVDQVDFVTSVGHGAGPLDRGLLGLRGAGPVRVITDLGVLEPDPDTAELLLTALHPGATVERVRAETGWALEISADLVETTAPTERELAALRSAGE